MPPGLIHIEFFSAAAMLKHSSLQDLFAHVLTLNDALIAGLIAARLFEDPFALHGSKDAYVFIALRIWDTAHMDACCIRSCLAAWTNLRQGV